MPYICDLESHMATVHVQKMSNLETKVNIPREIQFACYFCTEIFDGRVQLNHHQQKDHAGEKPCASGGEKLFSCDQCKKSFWWKTNAERHLITHAKEKAYACRHCGKRYVLDHSQR